jgi:serine/threonine protein kinase
VAYLHSMDVVHGDLKGTNVLLKGSAVTRHDGRGFVAKVGGWVGGWVGEHAGRCQGLIQTPHRDGLEGWRLRSINMVACDTTPAAVDRHQSRASQHGP